MTTRDGRGHLTRASGRSTVTTVGPRSGLTMSMRPSTACTRSVRPIRPLDDEPTRESCAPPMPSSRTTRRNHRPCCAQVIDRPRRLGVLGHVGQELGHAEVGDRLDGRSRAVAERHGELGGDGAPGGQSGQGALEPDVEGGGVDPPGQVPQLDDGLLGAAVGVVDELGAPGRDRGGRGRPVSP